MQLIAMLLAATSVLAAPPPKAGVGETPAEFEKHYSLPPLADCRLKPSPFPDLESTAATIDIGGRRFLTLIGLREGKVADYRSYPLDVRPQGATCEIKCFNKEISVHCANGSEKAREFRYYWDPKTKPSEIADVASVAAGIPSGGAVPETLLLIKRTGTDETETAVKALYAGMEEGIVPPACTDIRGISGIDQPKYSGPERLHQELTKARKNAQAMAKKKHFAQAASHLERAFVTTTRVLCCSGWLQCTDSDGNKPRAWVEARTGTGARNPANLYWVAYPIPNGQYLDTLRDYGNYLDESGEHLKAIEIFRLGLERDRQNTDFHLGLADALWGAGDHKSGADQYRTYADIFAKTRSLPKRVKQRMRK